MSGNGDTLNALRIKLNAAKDALYWADDVAPTRDFGTAQKALEEFARMVHNGEQRSRSTRDGLGVLDGTPPPPRASALVTSEIMPRPGSAAQRMLVVPLQAREIELNVLKELDTAHSRHGRALLMATYLQWLCPRLDIVRAEAFAEGERYSERLRTSGESVRQADALGGSLWAGWHAMSRFLVDVGALTENEVAQVGGDLVTMGLSDAAAAATDPDLPMRTGARVRELLVHALRNGHAYVEDVDTGQAPSDWSMAACLGWRRSVVGETSDGTPRWRAEGRGVRLGYVVANPRPCDGQPQVLLDPMALEQVLKATGQTMTDTLQIDRGTALRALYDEGVLIAEERKGRMPRYTVQRMVKCENRRQRMVALRLHKLLGSDGPEDQVTNDAGSSDPTLGGDSSDSSTPVPGGPALFDGWIADLNSPGSGVASGDSSNEVMSLTSSHSEQEPEMAIETDAEGHTADGVQISPVSICALCGGEDAGWQIDGLVMHLPCWWQSTAATRSAAAATGDTVGQVSPMVKDEPVAAPVETTSRETAAATPAIVATAETTHQPTTTTPAPKLAAGDARTTFTAPAAVLDVDGAWLPDGTRHDLASQITHVGDVAELVATLNLGTWTSDKWSVPGQIWITDAMAQHMGIDTSSLGKRNRNDRLKELTAQSPFVTEALSEAGSSAARRGGTASALGRECGKVKPVVSG